MALLPLGGLDVGRRDRPDPWPAHPLAALAILVSMAYAMVLELVSGFPFIAPDPYQIPEGDYAGPMGVGEPPSWEKAAMYVVMCLVLITSGGGLLSLDNLLIADLLGAIL